MQTTLTISLATFRVARTHSAEKDIRNYLRGVYLDTQKGKMVATDGHRMFIANARGIKLNAVAPFIIPNELIDAALKQFTGEYARGKMLGDSDVVITIDAAQNTLTIKTPTGQISGAPLNGQFPEWRRVVPKAEDVETFEPAILNWQYVTQACEAITIARNTSKAKSGQHAVRVHHRGTLPAVVCDSGADVLVIVMPLRNDIHAEAHQVACRMAHEDALGYDTETRERVAA